MAHDSHCINYLQYDTQGLKVIVTIQKGIFVRQKTHVEGIINYDNHDLVGKNANINCLIDTIIQTGGMINFDKGPVGMIRKISHQIDMSIMEEMVAETC